MMMRLVADPTEQIAPAFVRTRLLLSHTCLMISALSVHIFTITEIALENIVSNINNDSIVKLIYLYNEFDYLNLSAV